MKRLLEIVIGEENGEYFGMLSSSTDGQKAIVRNINSRVVTQQVLKLASKKLRQLKNFPLPDRAPAPVKSKIVYPGNGAPKIITPPGFVRS